MKKIIYLSSITLLALFCACGSNNSSSQSGSKQDSLAAQNDTMQKTQTRIVKAQKVFYNIPSPIETAGIFEKSGATYDKSFLNPYQNVSQYNTTAGKALNLGVYGADLSFTGIFNQTQASMYYMNSAKKLSDGLNVTKIFTPGLLNRLNNNINNRDSVLKIIADSYWRVDAYFKSNDRKNLSAFVIIGGWVEGLYIGTQMVKDTTKKSDLTTSIAQQKYSINDLNALLNTYSSDTAIAHLQSQLQSLQSIFDTIEETNAKPTTTKKNSNGVTVISGGSDLNYDMQTIMKIKRKVASIRNEIIQTN